MEEGGFSQGNEYKLSKGLRILYNTIEIRTLDLSQALQITGYKFSVNQLKEASEKQLNIFGQMQKIYKQLNLEHLYEIMKHTVQNYTSMTSLLLDKINQYDYALANNQQVRQENEEKATSLSNKKIDDDQKTSTSDEKVTATDQKKPSTQVLSKQKMTKKQRKLQFMGGVSLYNENYSRGIESSFASLELANKKLKKMGEMAIFREMINNEINDQTDVERISENDQIANFIKQGKMKHEYITHIHYEKDLQEIAKSLKQSQEEAANFLANSKRKSRKNPNSMQKQDSDEDLIINYHQLLAILQQKRKSEYTMVQSKIKQIIDSFKHKNDELFDIIDQKNKQILQLLAKLNKPTQQVACQTLKKLGTSSTMSANELQQRQMQYKIMNETYLKTLAANQLRMIQLDTDKRSLAQKIKKKDIQIQNLTKELEQTKIKVSEQWKRHQQYKDNHRHGNFIQLDPMQMQKISQQIALLEASNKGPNRRKRARYSIVPGSSSTIAINLGNRNYRDEHILSVQKQQNCYDYANAADGQQQAWVEGIDEDNYENVDNNNHKILSKRKSNFSNIGDAADYAQKYDKSETNNNKEANGNSKNVDSEFIQKGKNLRHTDMNNRQQRKSNNENLVNRGQQEQKQAQKQQTINTGDNRSLKSNSKNTNSNHKKPRQLMSTTESSTLKKDLSTTKSQNHHQQQLQSQSSSKQQNQDQQQQKVLTTINNNNNNNSISNDDQLNQNNNNNFSNDMNNKVFLSDDNYQNDDDKNLNKLNEGQDCYDDEESNRNILNTSNNHNHNNHSTASIKLPQHRHLNQVEQLTLDKNCEILHRLLYSSNGLTPSDSQQQTKHAQKAQIKQLLHNFNQLSLHQRLIKIKAFMFQSTGLDQIQQETKTKSKKSMRRKSKNNDNKGQNKVGNQVIDSQSQYSSSTDSYDDNDSDSTSSFSQCSNDQQGKDIEEEKHASQKDLLSKKQKAIVANNSNEGKANNRNNISQKQTKQRNIHKSKHKKRKNSKEQLLEQQVTASQIHLNSMNSEGQIIKPLHNSSYGKPSKKYLKKLHKRIKISGIGFDLSKEDFLQLCDEVVEHGKGKINSGFKKSSFENSSGSKENDMNRDASDMATAKGIGIGIKAIQTKESQFKRQSLLANKSKKRMKTDISNQRQQLQVEEQASSSLLSESLIRSKKKKKLTIKGNKCVDKNGLHVQPTEGNVNKSDPSQPKRYNLKQAMSRNNLGVEVDPKQLKVKGQQKHNTSDKNGKENKDQQQSSQHQQQQLSPSSSSSSVHNINNQNDDNHKLPPIFMSISKYDSSNQQQQQQQSSSTVQVYSPQKQSQLLKRRSSNNIDRRNQIKQLVLMMKATQQQQTTIKATSHKSKKPSSSLSATPQMIQKLIQRSNMSDVDLSNLNKLLKSQEYSEELRQMLVQGSNCSHHNNVNNGMNKSSTTTYNQQQQNRTIRSPHRSDNPTPQCCIHYKKFQAFIARLAQCDPSIGGTNSYSISSRRQFLPLSIQNIDGKRTSKDFFKSFSQSKTAKVNTSFIIQQPGKISSSNLNKSSNPALYINEQQQPHSLNKKTSSYNLNISHMVGTANSSNNKLQSKQINKKHVISSHLQPPSSSAASPSLLGSLTATVSGTTSVSQSRCKQKYSELPKVSANGQFRY